MGSRFSRTEPLKRNGSCGMIEIRALRQTDSRRRVNSAEQYGEFCRCSTVTHIHVLTHTAMTVSSKHYIFCRIALSIHVHQHTDVASTGSAQCVWSNNNIQATSRQHQAQSSSPEIGQWQVRDIDAVNADASSLQLHHAEEC